MPENEAKRLCVTYACDCAERPLPKFEAKYPKDTRPRAAIEAARSWLADPSDENARLARAAAYATYAERAWQKQHLIELCNGVSLCAP